MFERRDFAVPGRDAEEFEPYVRVRIDETSGKPRPCCFDDDPELLFEFARKGRGVAFARFDLAAGKLPVAGVNLAFRAAGEQVFRALGRFAQQDGGGDLGLFAGRQARRPAPRLPCCAAQSLANCQATRPLREPRISAQLSASRSAWAIWGSAKPKLRSQWAAMAR